jgi:hypothetical protein
MIAINIKIYFFSFNLEEEREKKSVVFYNVVLFIHLLFLLLAC